jgi:hypothetical protein
MSTALLPIYILPMLHYAPYYTPGRSIFTTLRMHDVVDLLLRDLLGKLQSLLPHGKGIALVEIDIEPEFPVSEETIEIRSFESPDCTTETSGDDHASNKVVGHGMTEVGDFIAARRHALFCQSKPEPGPRKNSLEDGVCLLCPVIPCHVKQYEKRPGIYDFMILSTIYSSLVISTKLPNSIQKASPLTHLLQRAA